MKVKEKKWIRVRIYLLAFFFITGLGVILARAYQLQILQKDRLASIARAGYQGSVKLPPKRGTIYDREGHELAISIEVGSIYAHPPQVERKALVAGKLSNIIEDNKSNILHLLKKKNNFVWIKRKISPRKVKEVHALGFKGIGSASETRRYYPGKEIAGHLIGFSGQDNQGLEGLERKFDNLLRGPQYTLIQMRDALKRPFYIGRPIPDGQKLHNLTLTIDKDIQYQAQKSLKWMVKKTRAKSGHCIVMDPHTGEVLAMAVVPLFNPNVFRKHNPAEWRNRAVTDTYEPGSTIKALLLAAALEKRIVSPRTKFNCEQGAFDVANHTIHDTKEHGVLSVSEIITLSSNIGAVKVGLKLGYGNFHNYLKKFGFGTKTGIDVIGERKGFIRSATKARKIEQATIFFGQGMTASSIQLTTAMAAIANGGKLMRPFVVKNVADQYGRIIKKTRPHMVRRVISPETAHRVALILEGVVGEKGTGPQAAISGYRVAGKTGTSQKVDPRTKTYSRKKYVAVFVGFVPVKKPKLVILAMVDEPVGTPYGGIVAGPVFRKVGGWTLNHMRVHPDLRLVEQDLEKVPTEDDPGNTVSSTPQVFNGEGGGDRLPDFKGHSMREVLTAGRALGLKVILEGTGLAYSQTPGPGTALQHTRIVKVNFRPPM